MKKKISRISVSILTAIMAVSLTACGNGGKTDSNVSGQKEFVYVPEYIKLGVDEDTHIYNIFVAGNSVYYTQNYFNQETTTWETNFIEYSVDTAETREIPIKQDENGNISHYVVDADGNFYTVEYHYGEPDENGMYGGETQALCKYDAQGNVVYQQDITEIMQSDINNAWVSGIVADAQGRIYMTSDNLIRLFDEEGKLHGTIDQNNGWVNGIGTGKDGKVYICYYDQNSSNGSMALTEINYEGKQLGQTYTNFPNGNNSGNLPLGIDKDFLVHDGSRVYEYDMAAQSYEEIFTWLDSDINGSYVDYVGVLENGKILTVIRDWNTGETELAYLTKTASSELPEKKTLTIASLSDNQSLQAAAVRS